MSRWTSMAVMGVVAVVAALTGAAGSPGATGSVELYVADITGGTIERVDPSEGTVGPGVAVTQLVLDIDITPDGRTAYAVSGFTNTVVPVDLEASTAGTPIPLTCGTQMAIVPGGQKAYVTQGCGTTVTPLDLITNTTGTPIEVGPDPFGIAVTPDGTTAYVATGGGAIGSTNALVPIDVANDTAGTPIPIGVEGAARSVVITPDGSTAFVAMERSDTVVPVDLAAGTVESPIAVSTNPVWLALTPDASTLFVTHNALEPTGLGDPAPTDVTPIDVASRTALPDIVVGGATTGVVVAPDGTTAYVSVLADSDTASEIVPIDAVTLAPGTPIVLPGDSYALALRPQPSDATPPTLAPTVTGSGPGGSVLLNDPAAVAQANADDGTGSGVASSSCGTPDVSTPGPHAVSCTATDVAGNTSTTQATYVVEYQLVGLSPADGSTARAVKPLKINVSLADAGGAPASLCTGCTVEVQMFAASAEGPFAMSHHRGSDEYRFSWKPSASGSGTARIVVSVHYPGTTAATSVESTVTVT